MIVVDFGTSTNFDVVSPEGEYVGGVLAPGIEISMDALFARAARLVKVDFVEPATVIGKTTVAGLQSGLVYGFAGQVDGIVGRDPRRARRRRAGDRDGRPRRAGRAARATIERVDPFLTLEGLRLVWELNRVIPDPPAHRRSSSLPRSRSCSCPGPAVLYIVAQLDPRRAAAPGSSPSLGDPRGTLVAHRGRDARPLGARARRRRSRSTAVKIAGAGVPHRRSVSGRCSRAAAEPDVALGGERNLRRAFAQGDRRERPQPEDGALLPRLPAAVRRSERAAPGGCRSPSSAFCSRCSAWSRTRLWALAAGTAGGMLAALASVPADAALRDGTVYVGLGVATALAGSASSRLAAAVDRDRQLERDLVARRELGLEALESSKRARRGREQPPLDLLGRVELHELLLERPREAAAAEVPAVELLQEAGRAALAELADGLAHEEDELGDDLLAGRLAVVAATISRSAHGLPCAARPTMTAAAPVVASTVCARARDVMSPEAITGTSTSDDELGGERVVGRARVHLLRRARMERQRRRARLDEPRPELEAGARAVRGGRGAASP